VLLKEQRDCWQDCQGTTKCTMKEWVLLTRGAVAAAWKGDEFPAALEQGIAVLDRDAPNTAVSRLVGFVNTKSD
jgi:hypothetical protein